jgi:hypothetical protein
MKIIVEHEIPDTIIESMIVSMFEMGASAYWISKVTRTNPECKDPDYEYLKKNYGLVITDQEGDTKTLYFAMLENGMVVLAKAHPDMIDEILKENDDGDIADAWLQCSLFGEIIYG